MKNLPVRMRYYQCSIDESSLNKGSGCNDLPDTFIIFFCTFDYLNKGLPVYTITPSCAETGQRFNDGTTKIIINSKAAEKADGELKEFLQYMNGKRGGEALSDGYTFEADTTVFAASKPIPIPDITITVKGDEHVNVT